MFSQPFQRIFITKDVAILTLKAFFSRHKNKYKYLYITKLCTITKLQQQQKIYNIKSCFINLYIIILLQENN